MGPEEGGDILVYISVCRLLCDVYHVTLGQYVYACRYVYLCIYERYISVCVHVERITVCMCIILCLTIIVYLYVQVSVSLECLFDTMFICIRL